MFKISQFLVLMTVCFVAAIAAPIQELPPKPGYVPVYIREGNTPLSQVNPKLVEAFHEDEDTQQVPVENEKAKEDTEAAVEAKVEEIPAQKEEDNKDEIKEEVKANDEPNVTKIEPEDKEEKAIEKEAEASDIAEFTSDDMKILADEKTDN